MTQLVKPWTSMVKLNTGYSMPIIGLGTFKITQDVMNTVIEAALATGYRAIDTAWVYKNEAFIGQALSSVMPSVGLSRSDIFLTTKLPPRHHGYEQCIKSCNESLAALQTDYLDLYLIHWPGAQKLKPEDSRHADLRRSSWKAMEELVGQGKVRSIGVSNYTKKHMEELMSYCTVKPAVLQIEYHPHLIRKEMVDFCKENDIHFQAYSSLGTSVEENKLLSDPVVMEISKKYNKTVPQILLRWAIQQNIGVIPKSCTPSHIAENIQVFDFDISPNDMATLSELDTGTRYCWNSELVV